MQAFPEYYTTKQDMELRSPALHHPIYPRGMVAGQREPAPCFPRIQRRSIALDAGYLGKWCLPRFKMIVI